MATAETEDVLKSLMLAGLAGDASAHRSLLARLSRHLRAYFHGRLSRFGRTTTDAEDLVQETLLAIHTKRHTYDPSEPLTPWVHAIARYKLVDYLRRTRPSTAYVPVEDSEAILAATDEHARAESAMDIETLLARLPEKMQRVIRYVKIEGLSVTEAARRCGMSEAAVKINGHRGLKALSRSISGRRGS